MKYIDGSIRWAFLALLIHVPWAMAGVPAWAENQIVYFTFGLGAAFFFCRVLSLALRVPHPVMLLAGVWILAQGWWMAYNAEFFRLMSTGQLIPIEQPFPEWPGSYNRDASFLYMFRVSALLLVMWMAGEISHDPKWRHRVMMAFGIAAASLLFFGIYHKILGSDGFWPQYGKNVWPFATFYYHGNAGAFINLCIPLVAALVWRAFLIDSSSLGRSVWSAALVISVAAVFVNASKGALLVFAGELVLIAILLGWSIRKVSFNIRSLAAAGIGSMVMLVAAGAVALSGGTESAWQRWLHALEVGRAHITEGRLNMANACAEVLPQAGWFGFGPDTFRAIFPYIKMLFPDTIHGIWLYAHQDYLQAVLEWGYAGTAAWVVLFGYGMAQAYVLLVWDRGRWRKRDVFLLSMLQVALLGVLIHALVDFPLQILCIQYYVAVALGMVWGSPFWKPRLEPREKTALD